MQNCTVNTIGPMGKMRPGTQHGKLLSIGHEDQIEMVVRQETA